MFAEADFKGVVDISQPKEEPVKGEMPDQAGAITIISDAGTSVLKVLG